MYETHWHLDSKPFENTPDPKFLYFSPKYEEALMRLMYVAREHKQGAILTGEYGSGKTLLSMALLKDLKNNESLQTVLIVNPKLSNEDLLREVLFQMGKKEAMSVQEESTLRRLLEEQLRQNLQMQKRTVLVIDEAQILDEKQLEEFRLLFNFKTQTEFLLTLILIGQSELKKKIQNVEPLQQRLSLRFHLEPLSLKELKGYVNHRLSVVGRTETLFSPMAMRLIHEGSRGIPRQVNNICDFALLIGFARKKVQVGAKIVKDCLKDLELKIPEKKEKEER